MLASHFIDLYFISYCSFCLIKKNQKIKNELCTTNSFSSTIELQFFGRINFLFATLKFGNVFF